VLLAVVAICRVSDAAPEHRHSIRGVLVHKGKPLAGLPLEMCGDRDPHHVDDVTPCQKSPRRVTGTTNADGQFVFANIPDGSYQIFILKQPYHTQTLIIRDLRADRDIGLFEVRATTD
jgi:hypothetical protein